MCSRTVRVSQGGFGKGMEGRGRGRRVKRGVAGIAAAGMITSISD